MPVTLVGRRFNGVDYFKACELSRLNALSVRKPGARREEQPREYQRAVEEAFAVHEPSLKRLLDKYGHYPNYEDAQDVLREAFDRALVGYVPQPRGFSNAFDSYYRLVLRTVMRTGRARYKRTAALDAESRESGRSLHDLFPASQPPRAGDLSYARKLWTALSGVRGIGEAGAQIILRHALFKEPYETQVPLLGVSPQRVNQAGLKAREFLRTGFSKGALGEFNPDAFYEDLFKRHAPRSGKAAQLFESVLRERGEDAAFLAARVFPALGGSPGNLEEAARRVFLSRVAAQRVCAGLSRDYDLGASFEEPKARSQKNVISDAEVERRLREAYSGVRMPTRDLPSGIRTRLRVNPALWARLSEEGLVELRRKPAQGAAIRVRSPQKMHPAPELDLTRVRARIAELKRELKL